MEPYFQRGFFLRGALFSKVAGSNSYSGERKLILMMYMVQVYKKSVFLEVYVSIPFFWEREVHIYSGGGFL